MVGIWNTGSYGTSIWSLSNMSNTSTSETHELVYVLPMVFVWGSVSMVTMISNGLVCLTIWKDPHKTLRSPFSPYIGRQLLTSPALI